MNSLLTSPGSNAARREEMIQQRAYFLWLESGQLHGQHDQHWVTAAEQVDKDIGAASEQHPSSPEASAPKQTIRKTVASHQADPAHRFHKPSKAHDGRLDVIAGEARQRVRSRSSNLQPPKTEKTA